VPGPTDVIGSGKGSGGGRWRSVGGVRVWGGAGLHRLGTKARKKCRCCPAPPRQLSWWGHYLRKARPGYLFF